MEKKRRFGATNHFPDGKLNKGDEGELQFGIAHDEATVILNFGKPVVWLGLGPSDAKALAAMLTKHANDVLGKVQ